MPDPVVLLTEGDVAGIVRAVDVAGGETHDDDSTRS